jgi:hypothetical protein
LSDRTTWNGDVQLCAHAVGHFWKAREKEPAASVDPGLWPKTATRKTTTKKTPNKKTPNKKGKTVDRPRVRRVTA